MKRISLLKSFIYCISFMLIISLSSCSGGGDPSSVVSGSSGTTSQGTTSQQPGEAASIILSSTNPDPAVIGITGGGVTESLVINLQVVDINNEPVTGNYLVDFSILNGGLNGGERLNNAQATTSDAVASVVFNSGTEAGTVQIRATLNSDPTIFADVSVTISGGLPAGNAFGLSATPLNLQGRKTWGLEQDIRVSVADFYSNPVSENSQVQFQTDYASATGSASFATDASGNSSSASATITSGPPEPNDGFVRFVAQAIGGSYSKVLSAAIDPIDPNIIYVGTDGGGIFKSINGGSSWTHVGKPLKEVGAAKFENLYGSIVRDLVIDNNDSSVIYAATNEGVFVSTNSGENWHSLTGLRRIEGDNLGTTTGAAFVSGYGETFSFNFQHTSVRSRTTIYLNGSPTSDYHYLTSSNGILFVDSSAISLAPGLTVTADYDTSSILPDKPVYAVAVNPDSADFNITLGHANTIYAGVYGGGVYKTSNGGRSWSKASTMADGETVSFGSRIISLAINSLNTSELYAGSENEGLFKTTDSAATWTKMTGTLAAPINETEVRDIVLQSLAGGVNNIWIAGKNAIHYSTDGGSTWNSPTTNVNSSDPANTDTRAIVRDSSDGTLYAATYGDVLDNSSPHGGIYRSTNNGATWTKLSDIALSTGAHTIETLAIYGQSGNDVLVAGTEGRSVYRSSNSGSSWSLANGSEPATIKNTLFTTIRLLHTGDSLLNSVQYFCGTYQGGGECSTIWPGETALFYIRVSDDLGHPLITNSSFSVTVDAGKATGDVSFDIADATYGGRQLSDMYVGWYNEPTLTEDTAGELTISVTSDNGNQTLKIPRTLYAKLQARQGDSAVTSIDLTMPALSNRVITSVSGFGGSHGTYSYSVSNANGSITATGDYTYTEAGLNAGDERFDEITITDDNTGNTVKVAITITKGS